MPSRNLTPWMTLRNWFSPFSFERPITASPVWHAYWPLSGRNSTYPAVQISRASSIVALAQEQPLADDRAENADGGGGAAIIGMVVNQHPADAVGVVDQNPVAPEEGGGDDIL